MKNVWIFSHYSGPPELVPHTRHYRFAKHLIRGGYNVKVFASGALHNTDKSLIDKHGPAYMEKTYDGVPFVFLKTGQYRGNGIARVKNMADYYLGLFKVSKRFERPDVILASSPHPLTCVAGIKIAKKMHIPCICEVRDLWPESIVAYKLMSRANPIVTALYMLEKWIYKSAERVIFTAKGGKDYICDRGWEKDIDLSKIEHINNGIDLDEFEENAKEHILQDEDLDNDEIFKLVYTGSLRKVNQIDGLISAAEVLADMNSRVRILIWGRGDHDEELAEQISRKNLSNIVIKGAVHKKYIPSILKRCDASINHWQQTSITKYGTSPNKLFDYLAAGKPVISSASSAYDIVVENNAGIVAKSISAQDIAAAISEIASCPQEKYEEYCANALALSAQYDFKQLTAKLKRIIEEII